MFVKNIIFAIKFSLLVFYPLMENITLNHDFSSKLVTLFAIIAFYN